jgi:two-component system, chemotaxis family, protein-glutamate methylesterase/glutaminase
LRALQIVLGALPKEFTRPIVVVQHRGRGLDGALAGLLAGHCALPVCEPEDKEVLAGGRVYVAPGDYHLLIEPGSIALSTEGAVQHARPSIDVLFESAADAYGDGVLAVVLTGASSDGAAGVVEVKRQGGCVIVEDPKTAESRTMPASAIAAANVDFVLPLEEIAGQVVALCENVEPARG